MKAAIVIPARYASTRLPGKPLLSETGKPLIQHVYERAMEANEAASVVVATDDARIFDAVRNFGGKAVMTGVQETGSARVAEAAAAIDAQIIVNLQGDEPEIDPGALDRLIGLQRETGAFASTLACRFKDKVASGPGSPEDAAAVKVIPGAAIDAAAFWARYFTRNICPWPRDDRDAITAPSRYFLHLGVYAFSRRRLFEFAAQPVGALEASERLEQLRILEMGARIAVGVVDDGAPGIDTPDDYRAFVHRVKKGAA
ncbi:MAG: 3-deoxy-manno-octulosonate cytidylyltransferase [Pseudomonadota bacterium]